jgi:polysaccharide biosynthesis/export protein
MRRYILFFIVAVFLLHNAASSAQEYMVGEGDVVKITVYNHEDLTTVTRVSGEGTIEFPLIGQVQVQGLTLTQISSKIAELLADGYVVEPNVSIFMQEFRSKKAFIMGEVNKPGLHVLAGNTTLLELLSVAGGVTEDAAESATIKRKSLSGAQSEFMITVDLKGLLHEGDTSLDVQILDGDTVYIQKAGKVYVTGEVKKPGGYKYEEGLTVIKAVALAGGFTNIASKSRVKIMRKLNGEEKVIDKVKMDDLVAADDVIVVPESFF